MMLGNILQRLTGGVEKAQAAAFPHVDLFHWSPAGNRENFGDHLSRVIVTKLLADHQHLLDEETDASHTLLAIGSILHFAQDHDVIWGSGVNGKIAADAHAFSSLDVRAVRGPLTRAFLMERDIMVPEIYGDPALLMPTLFPDRFAVQTRSRYVVVPNLHDIDIVRHLGLQNVVSPMTTWNRCIPDILTGELVIASSLHGLILAEAYGLPARYLRLSEEENIFKYNDYVMGTGRGEIEAARSIEEALEMGGMAPPVFDAQQLIAAFPFDLWDGVER
ncbi:MAG: hypothetical protein REI95_06335 [Oxalicibacterium faecigallinarum]|nr:hypothetical protein [Oxalicibacterium faecigallinarum]